MCFTGHNRAYISVITLNLVPSERKVEDYLSDTV